MEKSVENKARNVNSMKLLYKYQYVFLRMQKCNTSLLKVLKNIYRKTLLRSIRYWHLVIFPSLSVEISQFKFLLRSTEFKFQKILKAKKTKTFYFIISVSNLKKSYDYFYEKYRTEKSKTQKDLRNIEKELRILKNNQIELETISNRRSGSTVKEKNAVESLLTDNQELEKKIKTINRKTVELFHDLNSALDSFEQSRKTKSKKPKKKINAILRKSFLPITLT